MRTMSENYSSEDAFIKRSETENKAFMKKIKNLNFDEDELEDTKEGNSILKIRMHPKLFAHLAKKIARNPDIVAALQEDKEFQSSQASREFDKMCEQLKSSKAGKFKSAVRVVAKLLAKREKGSSMRPRSRQVDNADKDTAESIRSRGTRR